MESPLPGNELSYYLNQFISSSSVSIQLNPTSQLSSLGFASLLLTVPKNASKNLSTRALWNNIDELNTALQPFVLGLVLFHMLVDCFDRLLIRLLGSLG